MDALKEEYRTEGENTRIRCGIELIKKEIKELKEIEHKRVITDFSKGRYPIKCGVTLGTILNGLFGESVCNIKKMQ